MHVYVLKDQLIGLISYLKSYREKRFMDALISVKGSEMKIELVFHEKHMIHRTRNFDDIVDDNIVLAAEESFRINYFLLIST